MGPSKLLTGRGTMVPSGHGVRRVDWRIDLLSDIFADVNGGASSSKDYDVEAGVNTFIVEIDSNLTKLVVGDISMPVWLPNDYCDPTFLSHLERLRIPCLKGKPNLLLHDLGSFQDDPVLQKRLQNIFMPNNHT